MWTEKWRVLSKVARSPQTLARLFIDRICVPLWVRWLGVTIGTECSFVGQPVVKLISGAKIALGNEVRVFSRFNSNPAGLPHPTILAALAPESFITIGDNTGISGASIAARAGITIGRNVLIGAGACIWDTDFHPIDPYWRCEHPTRNAQCAPIRIDDDVFIGARAMILKGVTIGWGAVVGAGAVVTKDVGVGQVVAGNPARVVGSALLNDERVREEK
ncbi:MAG: acyltransferase [Nitrospiraceae bacterium]